ncbi:MAG: hypothetical protein JST54_19655 [Deltaproteobacteria bacterium]|nr:hypothetical protein [Deltaproteobacteria bacterium]
MGFSGRSALVAIALMSAGCDAKVILPSGDAGSVDAGRQDAGPSDAGPFDAGSVDAGSVDAGSVDAGPLDAGVVTATATFSPVALDPDAGDLTNPMRGQYLWLGTSAYPAGWTDLDAYERWEWVTVEPSEGNINWQLIDDQLDAARARGGRFGMRVMPLCEGCASHTYQGAQSSIPDDLAAVANPLIAAAPGDDPSVLYVLPDWNSDAYLNRLQELLQAIGTHYANDPTFAWMDVSSYGNWGEFHLYPFTTAGGPYDTSTQRPITDANAIRIVDMNAAAFPNKLLVVNSEQAAALGEAVATTSPPVGLRVDCVGSDGLAGGQSAISAVPGADQLWRRAPFITEWCQYNLGNSGADLFVQGEQQVRDFHISMMSSGNFQSPPSTADEIAAFRAANLEAGYRLRPTSVQLTIDRTSQRVRVVSHWVDDGVAPTYLAWQPVLVLDGPAHVELPLAMDLRQVMPDAPLDDDESLDASTLLTSGSYTASLRVDDVQAISQPMNLGIAGRVSDGSYALGSVQLP